VAVAAGAGPALDPSVPEPDLGAATPSTLLSANVLALLYVPVSVVVGTWWAYRIARPIRRFVSEERPPSEEERLAALRHPLRSAGIDAVGWLLGAVLLAVLNLRFSAELAFHVGSTVLMGGLTTIAVTYLLTERIMRPLTALALADESPPRLCGPGVQGRLLLAWLLATGVPLLGIAFVGLEGVVGGTSERVATSVLVLSVGAVLIGLAATVLVARSVGEPLLALRTALGRIEEGELDVSVAVNDGSEVGLLQSGFNRMSSGLRERERLHDLFGRHVGADVAREALDRPTALGGEQREVAVLFVDLSGRPSWRRAGRPPTSSPCSTAPSRSSSTPSTATAAGSTSSRATPRCASSARRCPTTAAPRTPSPRRAPSASGCEWSCRGRTPAWRSPRAWPWPATSAPRIASSTR
jgi:adenylate cyclase